MRAVLACRCKDFKALSDDREKCHPHSPYGEASLYLPRKSPSSAGRAWPLRPDTVVFIIRSRTGEIFCSFHDLLAFNNLIFLFIKYSQDTIKASAKCSRTSLIHLYSTAALLHERCCNESCSLVVVLFFFL